MAKWKNEPKNIIIRMPNWLGDAVMATPVLAEVRKKWPEAKITVMCQSNIAPLVKHDPHINEIFSFKRPSGWLRRDQYRNIIAPLKHGDYDLGILLTNSFSSAWWFWTGNVKYRVGFKGNFRNFLLNEAVPFPEAIEKQHLVITYKMLLESIGIPLSDTPPKLYISQDEKHAAIDLLTKYGIDLKQNTLIGINPGAAFGTAKCWLPERFQQVAAKLLENPNNYVVFFGDNAGAPLVNDICKQLPDRVINLAGKTSIRELIALIQLCHAFLTNDSGPMHIGAALGVPLVAIFGSTSDVKTGPYKNGVVIHKHVECSPCYKRICPIDFRCMKRIEVDEVYDTIQNLMKT